MVDSMVPNPFRKPREDFPLYPHRNGRWAKRVRGDIKYFGKCADDPKGEAALQLWLDQKEGLLAGRTPRAKGDGLTHRKILPLGSAAVAGGAAAPPEAVFGQGVAATASGEVAGSSLGPGVRPGNGAFLSRLLRGYVPNGRHRLPTALRTAKGVWQALSGCRGRRGNGPSSFETLSARSPRSSDPGRARMPGNSSPGSCRDAAISRRACSKVHARVTRRGAFTRPSGGANNRSFLRRTPP